MYIPGTNEFLSFLWNLVWPLLLFVFGRRWFIATG
jgi:hypothetical protein